MGYIHKVDFNIDYEYVDKHNKLTYKGFLKYLQDAATMHSNHIGYSFENLIQHGLAWLVLGWKIEIYKRPGTDEKIHVETWSTGFEKVSSCRDYKIFNSQKELIAIASSKWVLYDLKKGSLARITEEFASPYHPHYEHVFGEQIEKISEPSSEATNTYNYAIMRRDIDTNNHVHNTNYLDIAIEALPEEKYKNMNYTTVEIMYKKQALLGDKTTAMYHHEEDGDYIVIKSEDLKKLHCIVKFA